MATKEPLILPNNIKPKGVAKGDVGLMNREGTLTAIDWNGVETSVLGINPSNSVVVGAASTDLLRGESLFEAYSAAKLLTPNGLALSATNRAQVVLPPGKYQVEETFVLDANFVDILSLVTDPPSRRRTTDNDPDPNSLTLDLTSFRPQTTLIYTEVEKLNCVEQTAANVRLSGFSIAQIGSLANFVDLGELEWGAFMIGDVDNSESTYTNMYFWCGGVAYATAGGVRAYESFAGSWYNCIANGASFRTGYGDQTTPSAVFSAKMYDCEAGPYSFIGDFFTGRSAFYSVAGARFERCKCIGTVYGGEAGGSAFAGCTAVAIPLGSDCWFVDCEAGDLSFGLGVVNAANFIRCRAGASCFGASASNTAPATFSGYAEDCFAGHDSFGGRIAAADSAAASCKLTGTLVRCTVTGNTRPINLDGATIRDSRITTTTTGQNCLVLLDSDSQITGSELIVLQGGTGVPINAGSAFNVVAVANRMNNATNDADGLGANVTNLVASSGNVVSNSIR